MPVVAAFGSQIDVLVNVVGGICGRKQITEQDENWYNLLMDVNMKSCLVVYTRSGALYGSGRFNH
jgi:NADP-dependent 3-hydroxy acid dehydrogenase YdfG